MFFLALSAEGWACMSTRASLQIWLKGLLGAEKKKKTKIKSFPPLIWQEQYRQCSGNNLKKPTLSLSGLCVCLCVCVSVCLCVCVSVCLCAAKLVSMLIWNRAFWPPLDAVIESQGSEAGICEDRHKIHSTLNFLGTTKRLHVESVGGNFIWKLIIIWNMCWLATIPLGPSLCHSDNLQFRLIKRYECAGILRLLVGKAQSRHAPPDDEQLEPIHLLTRAHSGWIPRSTICFYISSHQTQRRQTLLSAQCSIKRNLIISVFCLPFTRLWTATYWLLFAYLLEQEAFQTQGPEDIYLLL